MEAEALHAHRRASPACGLVPTSAAAPGQQAERDGGHENRKARHAYFTVNEVSASTPVLLWSLLAR